MTFRRQRDEWDELLKRHGPELRECGIPDYIVSDKNGFLIFLDHGHDEGGWAESRYATFDAAVLTDGQIARLAELVERIEPYCGASVASRWRSSG